MIDYEKLKLAHKLYPAGYLKIIPIFNKDGELETMNYFMEIEGVMPSYFYTIDDLLAKITQPESRYKVGDEVIFLHHEGIEKGIVDEINVYNDCYIYHVVADSEGFQMGEARLFPTIQALIECQLQYWSKLYEEAYPGYLCLIRKAPENKCQHLWVRGKCHDCGIEKCEHEPCPVHADIPGITDFECVKCGVLYG